MITCLVRTRSTRWGTQPRLLLQANVAEMGSIPSQSTILPLVFPFLQFVSTFTELNNDAGVPDGSVVKNHPANAGDTGLIPGPGRSHIPRRSQAHALLLTKPSLLTGALEPRNCNCGAHVPQPLKPTCPRACAPWEKPLQGKAHAPQLENSPAHCS